MDRELRRADTSIHASAVRTGDRAVLIRGPSGAGKSRLAFDLILAGRAGQIPATVMVGDDAEYWLEEAAGADGKPEGDAGGGAGPAGEVVLAELDQDSEGDVGDHADDRMLRGSIRPLRRLTVALKGEAHGLPGRLAGLRILR